MKSEMAKRLKEILENTSQEQFNQEWTEIEALGLQGPSADEVLEYYTVSQNTTVEYEVQTESESLGYSGNINFALAA